jgi:hypothetical protein
MKRHASIIAALSVVRRKRIMRLNRDKIARDHLRMTPIRQTRRQRSQLRKYYLIVTVLQDQARLWRQP